MNHYKSGPIVNYHIFRLLVKKLQK